MTSFAVASVQFEARVGDNVAEMSRHVADVARRYPWVDMIMFGELAAHGPSVTAAQPMPGPTERHFCELARKHGVWLLPGTLYERLEGAIYNTAPVIDPNGRVVARYRKIYPFLPYEPGVTPGDACVTFEVPDVGIFGVSICYDFWFPETIRTLTWKGAEVILHPTMTDTPDRDGELAIARAHALTNQCYLIDVNSAGELALGRSIAVGPDGDVMHQCGAGQEIVPLPLDLERVRRSRREGTMGLGQPLKSFRDGPASFPPYTRGADASKALQSLGPLEMPGRYAALSKAAE
ncbi:carbon-nitrogen hydrolase family protein [Ferruginivarius sediminum]|uniref:Carbon-nitrogen hydrolase family protein n=1 Tax=Ferruginivarius sediminum TaxID=2661937 RepID=A0A369TD41_9PROT|nr:carbon-nitrogen hydrolase family protein [Ferruginivarius sediminum]RDD62305.1 carbon-nitrogen hydrolase family protein [Ferruginivarius sediminum]